MPLAPSACFTLSSSSSLQLASRLADMPPAEFQQHVEELAKSKAELPKRLREAAARDWSEVDSGSLR